MGVVVSLFNLAGFEHVAHSKPGNYPDVFHAYAIHDLVPPPFIRSVPGYSCYICNCYHSWSLLVSFLARVDLQELAPNISQSYQF